MSMPSSAIAWTATGLIADPGSLPPDSTRTRSPPSAARTRRPSGSAGIVDADEQDRGDVAHEDQPAPRHTVSPSCRLSRMVVPSSHDRRHGRRRPRGSARRRHRARPRPPQPHRPRPHSQQRGSTERRAPRAERSEPQHHRERHRSRRGLRHPCHPRPVLHADVRPLPRHPPPARRDRHPARRGRNASRSTWPNAPRSRPATTSADPDGPARRRRPHRSHALRRPTTSRGTLRSPRDRPPGGTRMSDTTTGIDPRSPRFGAAITTVLSP